MNPEQMSGLIRHFATLFGGYLIAKLNIPTGYFEAIVGGLAALGAVIWSFASKKPLPAESGKEDA